MNYNDNNFWFTSTRLGFMCFILMMMSIFGGCTSPKGELFPAIDASPQWPSEPAPARIVYVGELLTDADLKPAKTFAESIGDALFGRSAERSMLTPYAVCTDYGRRLFVCDSNAQLVHVFNLDTREYEQWMPTNGNTRFSQPVGIAYDFLNRLLVVDSVEHMIHVFSDKGEYLGDMGREFLVRPAGIAVDPISRRIYVADTGAHQIAVLAIDGELIRTVGKRGIQHGNFNFPTNVAVDGEGRLYVSDSLNFRVQVFEPDLQFLKQIGEKGDLPGYFAQPKGIALDQEGHIYVIDAHFECVQVFDLEGHLLLSFGSEGWGPGEFWLPAGIHIDANNRIWIADSYNRRIQVFDYVKELQP